MKTQAHLKFNDLAPDLEVTTAEGKKIRLSSLWAEKPLVLAFTRHFGCAQCKEMLDQLVQNKPQLQASGLDLVVVTQAKPEESSQFIAARAPGVLCLADPERELYHAYGLGRGTVGQTLLSPKIWSANARALAEKGYKAELPPPGQDAFLMSGSFIIATDGRVRLPYYYDHIADHPSADLLLKGFLSTDWNSPFEAPLGPKSK